MHKTDAFIFYGYKTTGYVFGLKTGKKAEGNKVYINEIKREREKRIKKEKEREE